jgi:phage-related protein
MRPETDKPLKWMGSSKRDLLSMPVAVRRLFGHALDYAQKGKQHKDAYVLKGFGSAGVLEIIDDDEGGTYRAVYTVKFKEAVFVLHVFQKKSTSGIAIPKPDMELIRLRFKAAEAMAEEMRNEKTND